MTSRTFLLSKYESYLDRYVADNTSGFPNPRSRPSTADVIFTCRARHLSLDNLPISFGDIVIVHHYKIKRDALARHDKMASNKVNPDEIAAILGYSKHITMAF